MPDPQSLRERIGKIAADVGADPAIEFGLACYAAGAAEARKFKVALWRCYELSGADTSGHEIDWAGYDLAITAVGEVRRLREESDADTARLEDARRPLVEALRKYGTHSALCMAEVARDEDSCDCGLDAALRAAEGGEASETNQI